MISKNLLLVTLASSFCLTACSIERRLEGASYWQRVDTTSSLYMRGPKAQQMLHQSISECTSSLQELRRLGEIRDAIPANYNRGNELSDRTAAEQELDAYETPTRDGYLLNEHLDYHDFETCMYSKGWERAEFLPVDDLGRAQKEYADQYFEKRRTKYMGDRENVTTLSPYSQNRPPYENVNQ
ncbi:MAG: hypothetical protein AAF549_03615 [Pseudomonadota bacterium]